MQHCTVIAKPLSMLGFAVFIILGFFDTIKGSPVVDPKVVNGSNANDGEFPFMVSLQTFDWEFCGGSLISDQWVLTAGHCLENTFSADIDVWYGDINLNPKGENKSVKVAQGVLHPNYTSDGMYLRNDIALLKLVHPINLNDRVRPIRLPKQDEPVPFNHAATLIGWGYTGGHNYQVPAILQKVNLTIFDQPYCDSYNAKLNFSDTQNICAGNIDNTKGQCSGDSGGPLFIEDVQWGIVSWSIKPCISAPGVFTRTSVFIDWIRNVTGI